MSKAKIIFFCTECGAESNRWSGRCSHCGAWNTLTEKAVVKTRERSFLGTPTARPRLFSEVDTKIETRWQTANTEWDRTLGGGVVPGSLVLLGGDPGVGKSTLILQVGMALAERCGPVLYASGEESETQVRLRADRLGLQSQNCYVFAMNRLESILSEAQTLGIKVLIIDSVQTMEIDTADGSAGSVTQVKECALTLLRFAKMTGTAVIIIGHVTKEGNVAGPRLLEHMVDTVLYLEGRAGQVLRILRAVKNRFGDTAESGVFAMKKRGLAAVSDLSRYLLAERSAAQTGAMVFAGLEGIRPVLVEVQALTARSYYGYPRRTAIGYDTNRLTVLLAVLEKRASVSLAETDVYVSLVGGIRLSDTAMDLAVVAAVISSFYELPIAPTTAALGEIGLTGDVRRVAQMEKRLQELAQVGFKEVLLPAGSVAHLESHRRGLHLVGITQIGDVKEYLLTQCRADR